MAAERKRFKKVLAANRGEIAIRIFRACTELGIRTVAVYSHADLLSIHRYKADEAYMIGGPGESVSAYLDMDEVIRIALEAQADAIHPGYGFLSENAEFAQKCEAVGITFIGPRHETLAVLSDKTSARTVAMESNVPVIPGSSDPLKSAADAREFGGQHGYPIILKAAFGGGGRGMRVIRSPEEIDDAFKRATSEAKTAFGRGELFCEKFIEHARHIEVQILADRFGHCVHLFERDCSVQRRHQKVIEVAPAIRLEDTVRERLYDAALRIAQTCNYQNAGTVEFLVDDTGQEYFIEVNPRIQVEHTVTEVITGRDLVQAQICIAQNYPLNDPIIDIPSQSAITQTGCAIQCRITTEDPQEGFMPDTGRILTYRAAAGFGIRLDAGTGGAGTEITGDFDSLIVKLTASALTFEAAVRKAQRSLREFRIRGVKTNIAFLERAVTHPVFTSGRATTRFIDNSPELMDFPPRKDRATKLLKALAYSVVNGPPGAEEPFRRTSNFIEPIAPKISTTAHKPSAAMAVFAERGASGLSQWLRQDKCLGITDTTMRDAHQSLLATRVRTHDLLKCSPATAAFGQSLFSLEVWGGATFDVAYRFLKECPWARLEQMRAAMPNVLLQMLLRGANGVGYKNYPDNVIRRFVQQAAVSGIDVFRVFDALNWLPNMEIAMEEVGKAGKIIEACICYTGDVTASNEHKYTLGYYLNLAKELEARGAHILAIKDMAGLLKPRAASVLVRALRESTDLPIHLHTHDTSGNGIATLLAAINADVDVVDCALSSMSGLTSQPSLNALIHALGDDPKAPSVDLPLMNQLTDYWEALREMYWPFESGLKASTADVYRHEIPGGQYSNLRPRAVQLGLGHRWSEIKDKYAHVNAALGNIIKVTPTSKVVADFAMFLVQNDLDVQQCIQQSERLDFPQSLVDFMSGSLGQPYQGFPEALQAAVLKGKKPLTQRAGADLACHDFSAAEHRLEDILRRPPENKELVSDALYPKVFADFIEYQDDFGETSHLPTPAWLYGLEVGEQILVEIEPGKTLVVRLVAVGEVDAHGLRRVYFELNGHPRETTVEDRCAPESATASLKADLSDPSHVPAAMPGKVIKVCCSPGDKVQAGHVLMVTEAMKMETSITAPVGGKVREVFAREGDRLSGGDLVVVLEPAEKP